LTENCFKLFNISFPDIFQIDDFVFRVQHFENKFSVIILKTMNCAENLTEVPKNEFILMKIPLLFHCTMFLYQKILDCMNMIMRNGSKKISLLTVLL